MRSPALLVPLLLAACVAPRQPPPPAAEPASPVVALPPAGPVDWRDAPLAAGTWRYRPGKEGSIAAFGVDAGVPLFVVQCEAAGRMVRLYRTGVSAPSPARVTTSSGVRSFPTGAVGGGTGWRLQGRDPALDEIAFSRGRFMVEGAGQARLVLPAWAEVARVIEDCRG